jgi:hypothetical protein
VGQDSCNDLKEGAFAAARRPHNGPKMTGGKLEMDLG